MNYSSFEEFETVLYRLADSKKYLKKQDAPLISPAVYKPDTTRANDNVVAWGGFGILDVDDFKGDIKDIEKKYMKVMLYLLENLQKVLLIIFQKYKFL